MKEQAKHKILAALAKCGDGGAFADAARGLFVAMGYDSGRSIPIDNSAKSFVSEYPAKREKTKSEEHFCRHVQRVIGLFQFSDSEMKAAGAQDKEAFDKSNAKSFLFFAAQVADGGHSRGDYAKWTREINKRFAIPAVVLFYCVKDGETKVTFSFVGSRQSKVAAQERVLEAVSLLREIDAKKPHRGHLDILAELSFDNRIDWIKGRKRNEREVNFDSLLTAWLNELNSEGLSNRFYDEIQKWFECAVDKVKFPSEMSNREHIIRLINRVLFIWFLKEKGLVAEELFERRIEDCLKDGLPDNGRNYYCAVLQNLFFGTLNTKIGKRDFRDRELLGRYGNPEHKDFSLYRYEKLISDKEKLMNYFKQTPFVNGGLFDCLDDFAAGGEGGKLVDCFTDNNFDESKKSYHKLLCVPNFLFFGNSEDTPGLFNILCRYKFTVEENTPTEQEVALDPELLGMVYERLLGTVANLNRKDVGAYYTPRRVVDYMMREVLTEYFAVKMPKANNLKNRLRDLLTAEADYESLHKEEKLNSVEARQFIELAARLRLLDPAVGSGAFLMGALAQITMAFNRIDPKNNILYQREKKHAEGFSDENAKERALEVVEEIFSEKNKYNNYGRKLTIIRDCLFGVDLLPAAVQICRLRFFISLAIEQEKNNNESENYGIRSLPNLEARMVAADTLRSIGKENPLFGESAQVTEIKKELRDIRRQFFAANTRAQKHAFIKKDKAKRKELAECLKSLHFPENAAKRIADWDLYDPKGKSDWFDPEWMFGAGKGFDVVIGNPPYVQLQNNQGELAVRYADEGFGLFQRTGDIYQLFYERGHDLLSENGRLCFITSNKWMRADYGKNMRDWLSKETGPIALLDLGPKIFASAIVGTCILMFSKKPLNPQNLQAANLKQGEDLLGNVLSSLPVPQAGAPWVILTPEESALKTKIEKIGKPLKEWDINIYYGVKTGCNEAFVIDNETKEALIKEDPCSADILKPTLRGEDIKRYKSSWEIKEWLVYTRRGLNIGNFPAVYGHLKCYKDVLLRRAGNNAWYELQASPSDRANVIFSQDKLIWGNMSIRPKFAIFEGACFPLAPTNILSGENLYYLSAILNSKFCYYSMKNLAYSREQGFMEWKKIFVEKIFIPPVASVDRGLFSKLEQLAKKRFAIRDQIILAADLEESIDRAVYALYCLTPREIRIIESAIKIQ